MRVFFGRDAVLYPEMDDTFDMFTKRYRVAVHQYQDLINKHARLNLSGSKPSPQQLLDEERAFEEIDSARYALLDAATLASPTLH